ncbi:polyketide cyclase [Sphingobium sp. SCG-1]|uniref:SRPBCC family protein n=1 Tax=Sphingobium sp. SCG-1 TaxID=2072936 RepID=UPI000CD6A9F9|nr:SRPBCC family protein [Sphingobium sp. SCG-1]AUW57830.1 polyketide cyclase [Sphingobium sp. SCG-1]
MTRTAQSARNPNDVPITREALVPGAIRDVFDFVAAEDVLPKILTGYGLVPGISHTSDITGPWDQPGPRRIVHLLDGSTVREGVTHYDRSHYFAYRVSDPSFALKHLMVEAKGEFWFEETDAGAQVRWTYTLRAKNRLPKLPLRLFVGTQWTGCMDVCMTNVIAHFDALRSAGVPQPALDATALPQT